MTSKKKIAAKKAAPVKKEAKAPVKKAAKPDVKASKKAAPKKVAEVKAVPKKKVVAPPVKAKAAPKKAVAAKKTAAKKAAPVKAVATKKKAAVKAEPKKAVKPVVASKPVKKQEPVAPVVPEKATKPSKVVIPKISTKSSVKYEPDFKSVLEKPSMEKAKSVIRYSDAELQEFKDIILRKLDAAKKELAYLQGLITRRDEGGDIDEGRYMTMEDGSVSMEREQLSQLASRQITFIDHLEKALVRVENKTYGICRVTGNLIDKARLRAVPHATLSMEAKSGMSK
ncbi:MAG: TraR/DksA C4-type zinc finger protein [Niabella sp.]